MRQFCLQNFRRPGRCVIHLLVKNYGASAFGALESRKFKGFGQFMADGQRSVDSINQKSEYRIYATY
jgi:hypothetical protein